MGNATSKLRPIVNLTDKLKKKNKPQNQLKVFFSKGGSFFPGSKTGQEGDLNSNLHSTEVFVKGAALETSGWNVSFVHKDLSKATCVYFTEELGRRRHRSDVSRRFRCLSPSSKKGLSSVFLVPVSYR